MTHNRLKRQMLNPLARDIPLEKATMESRKDFAAVVLAIDGGRAREWEAPDFEVIGSSPGGPSNFPRG